jgi:hypothetical protein
MTGAVPRCTQLQREPAWLEDDSTAVGLKVDFDVTLLVIANGLYRLLARKMCGYADAQARVIFRVLIDMPVTVDIDEQEVWLRIVALTCRSC